MKLEHVSTNRWKISDALSVGRFNDRRRFNVGDAARVATTRWQSRRNAVRIYRAVKARGVIGGNIGRANVDAALRIMAAFPETDEPRREIFSRGVSSLVVLNGGRLSRSFKLRVLSNVVDVSGWRVKRSNPTKYVPRGFRTVDFERTWLRESSISLSRYLTQKSIKI